MRPLEFQRSHVAALHRETREVPTLGGSRPVEHEKTRNPSEMSVEPTRGFRDIAPYRLTGPDETADTPIGRTWAVELMRAEQNFLLREF